METRSPARVGLIARNQGGHAARAPRPKSVVPGLDEAAADPATAVLGKDRQAEQVAPPTVPRGDDGTDDPSSMIGDERASSVWSIRRATALARSGEEDLVARLAGAQALLDLLERELVQHR